MNVQRVWLAQRKGKPPNEQCRLPLADRRPDAARRRRLRRSHPQGDPTKLPGLHRRPPADQDRRRADEPEDDADLARGCPGGSDLDHRPAGAGARGGFDAAADLLRRLGARLAPAQVGLGGCLGAGGGERHRDGARGADAAGPRRGPGPAGPAVGVRAGPIAGLGGVEGCAGAYGAEDASRPGHGLGVQPGGHHHDRRRHGLLPALAR